MIGLKNNDLAGKFFFKVTNKNNGLMPWTCSKLIIKTRKQRGFFMKVANGFYPLTIFAKKIHYYYSQNTQNIILHFCYWSWTKFAGWEKHRNKIRNVTTISLLFPLNKRLILLQFLQYYTLFFSLVITWSWLERCNKLSNYSQPLQFCYWES